MSMSTPGVQSTSYLSKDNTCLRELAVFLSHMITYTYDNTLSAGGYGSYYKQGLTHAEDRFCAVSGGANCVFHSTPSTIFTPGAG